MCLLHLHLQLAQILALPLACAVAMVTRYSRDGELGWTPADVRLRTSRAPGGRCGAGSGHRHVGAAQPCAREMEPRCPSWQGLRAAASCSLTNPAARVWGSPAGPLTCGSAPFAAPVRRLCTHGGAGQVGAALPHAQQPAGAPEGGLGIGRALAEVAAVEVAASLALRRVRSVCLGFCGYGHDPGDF